ncbi:MAG: DEAD/DEAH box helicase [Chloroflexi bacterium]|nr:DEAD/DEAH box helicase [Chloroflexota bacterium]
MATATASGKSLCYTVPVLQRLLDRPKGRALYLFPTKALAHDRWRKRPPPSARANSPGRTCLRRRHPPKSADAGAPGGRHPHHQSRHAARGHPALPSHLARPVWQPGICGARRNPHLSRCVWQPCDECAAPLAAHLRILRQLAPVHLQAPPPSPIRRNMRNG